MESEVYKYSLQIYFTAFFKVTNTFVPLSKYRVMKAYGEMRRKALLILIARWRSDATFTLRGKLIMTELAILHDTKLIPSTYRLLNPFSSGRC